jgi:hypothetical protein
MKTFLSVGLLTLFFSFAANDSALACAACYSNNGSGKMGDAAAIGIFAMVVIMCIMLGVIAAFGFHFRKLEKHPLPDYDELLSEDQPPSPEPPTKTT